MRKYFVVMWVSGYNVSRGVDYLDGKKIIEKAVRLCCVDLLKHPTPTLSGAS